MGKIDIDANEWAVYQGQQTFPIADPAILDFSMSVEGFVQVVGVRHDDVEVPVFSSNGSFHNKTLRIAGCKNVKFVPEKTTTDYGLLITYKTTSANEVVNDFAPPEPTPPANILAQLRKKARQEMGIGYPEQFNNDTGLPGYEMDDPLFEEEEVAISRAEQEQNAKKQQEHAEQNAKKIPTAKGKKPNENNDVPADNPDD